MRCQYLLSMIHKKPSRDTRISLIIRNKKLVRGNLKLYLTHLGRIVLVVGFFLIDNIIGNFCSLEWFVLFLHVTLVIIIYLQFLIVIFLFLLIIPLLMIQPITSSLFLMILFLPLLSFFSSLFIGDASFLSIHFILVKHLKQFTQNLFILRIIQDFFISKFFNLFINCLKKLDLAIIEEAFFTRTYKPNMMGTSSSVGWFFFI